MSNKEDLDLLDFDSTETKPVEVEKEQIKESDSGLKRAVYMGVSVFGAGFFPFASGTFGSLVTIPLAWLFIIIGGARGLAISSVVFFILGYIMVAIALQYSESSDPSFVVIDELVGQLLTFLLPVLLFATTIDVRFNIFTNFTEFMKFDLIMYLGGFLLFRLFDIVKPFPAGWIDKNVKGSLGVMLDDVVAGIYASIALSILLAIYLTMNAPIKPLM